MALLRETFLGDYIFEEQHVSRCVSRYVCLLCLFNFLNYAPLHSAKPTTKAAKQFNRFCQRNTHIKIRPQKDLWGMFFDAPKNAHKPESWQP